MVVSRLLYTIHVMLWVLLKGFFGSLYVLWQAKPLCFLRLKIADTAGSIDAYLHSKLGKQARLCVRSGNDSRFN